MRKVNKTETPLLSVCLITYNHAKFIRQAIDSVLLQEVNFTWELIIADDFSTDGTRDILLEYKEKYPVFITLILQKRNVGAAKNWEELLLFPKSKFIAYFEGDDYWTDPLKLKKQVSFLENNEDYGMCYTKCIYFRDNKYFEKKPWGGDKVSFEDLLKTNCVPSLTVVLKLDLLKEYIFDVEPSHYKWEVGDYPVWLWFAYNSKIYFIDEVTGVYGVHANSISRSVTADNKIKFVKSGIDIKRFYANKYNLKISDSKFKRMEISSKLKILAIYGHLPRFLKVWFLSVKQDYCNFFIPRNYRYLIFFVLPRLRKSRL